ncbi:hypothetical protein [Methylobacterium dankookense]|uniref:Uncharacterized protein n=1 Tax=Methylobacterium dankookense TaxID=560405 RepID=A0A564G890_9HYPH|nr:hypothetical protein [Methylobacterium dankookense]GJD59296.1 hypothetical protein IFDJLNFL_5224 [Methylobacterium dankookense]VUF16020.1 hypothetical protein MTDSW087_05769 [Methylobacterium dankookense]
MSTFTCAVGFFVLTCSAPDPVPDAARFCQTVEPVRYSRTDTAETRRQLRIFNTKWRALCGAGR